MRVKAWGRTDTGMVRDHNEDSHFVDTDHALFIVADGVGGSSRGEVASQTLVEVVRDIAPSFARLAREEDPVENRNHREQVFAELSAAIQKANARIYEEGKKLDPGRPMATTADVMLLVENAAFIAHVGDSRVYLLRGEKIFRITEDHTFAEQLKREKVNEPEVLERYKNVLTRSVGGKPKVDVDALFIDIKPGDRLLMCSDGLTGYLSGSEIIERARQSSGEELLEELVEEAKRRGGADNITAVLVTVEEQEQESNALRDTTQFDTLRQVDILGRITLFRDLDIRELLKVMRIISERQYDAGETVIEHGEEGEFMYIVAEGSVELSVDDRQVAHIETGSHFGEFALIGEAPRSATATAVGETLLLTIPANRFRDIVREDPSIGNKLLWNLLESASLHIRRMTDEMIGYRDKDEVNDT